MTKIKIIGRRFFKNGEGAQSAVILLDIDGERKVIRAGIKENLYGDAYIGFAFDTLVNKGYFTEYTKYTGWDIAKRVEAYCANNEIELTTEITNVKTKTELYFGD